MFRNKRLARLARKIKEYEQEKEWYYHEFKSANQQEDVEKTTQAWRKLEQTCRRLTDLRRAQRRLQVKTKG